MILTAGPSITEREVSYVTDAIKNGHGKHWGDYIKKFEEKFAEYVGAKHALATSSCTGAMHMALVALGVQEGDEVIIPDLTWIATASVVCYTGAKPVFVDVLPDTWCIDPDDVKKKVTARTKAIIPVHLYGNLFDVGSVMDIAEKYGLEVMVDGAPSVGSEYHGEKTGGMFQVECFSFQGAKILSTGEGGMIATINTSLFEKIKRLSEHGRVSQGFAIKEIGYKYKMSNLQAAMGLAQLERINDLVEKRRLIHGWYSRELEDVEGIALNPCYEADTKPNYWMVSMVLWKSFRVTRDQLMEKLRSRGVDTRPFFPRVSSFGMFQTYNSPVAAYLSNNGINLPSAHDLTEDQVIYICDCIKEIL